MFPPGLKGCSGQGACWPSSIFLGASGSRARQGPEYSPRSKQRSAQSPGSALPIHHLTRSSLAPLCVCPPLPQLLSLILPLLLLSQGLLLPPLTFPGMEAALTGCRIACRRHRTFPAPQGSALCLPISLADRTAWAVVSQDLVPQIIAGPWSSPFPSAFPPAQHHSCGGAPVEVPVLYLWGFNAEIAHVQ